jgi:WD40 repeat protein
MDKDRNYRSGWIFSGVVPGRHRGPVNVLIHSGDEILSGGEDGFLEIWNIRTAKAEERFQLSSGGIKAMALRPEKPELCVIESDELGLYRISAWNYRNRENIFTLRFRDPVNFVTYSAQGNFIIAARTGKTGLVFIHPETGGVLKSPEALIGNAAFAATGKSERSMIVYAANGELSYWDLESGNKTNSFETPLNLSSPVMFGNNRYLAGIDSRGLVVVDAVSGDTLGRDSSVPRDSLLYAPDGGMDFYCLVQGGASPGVYRFGIDRSGRLNSRNRIGLPPLSAGASAFFAGEAIVIGTNNGEVLLLDGNGRIRPLDVKPQMRITETAVSGGVLAFLTENNGIGFIPLDYYRINGGEALTLEKNSGFSRISPFRDGKDGEEKFLFWQTGNTLTAPEIRSAGGISRSLVLKEPLFRFPLRSVETNSGKILFLDTSGALSLVTIGDDSAASLLFSFSSIGSMDADFANDNNVILGRSAVLGSSPFLIVNTVTGETVPIPYPSQAGVMVFRGASGGVYGAVVDQNSEGVKTSILRLNISNPSRPEPLVEYQGEDTRFSLAEASGLPASSLGGEGASIYTPTGILKFDRTPGLPLKIESAGDCFIVLDEEGNICWHESGTGKALAIFRIYPNEWMLQREDRALWGGVEMP